MLFAPFQLFFDGRPDHVKTILVLLPSGVNEFARSKGAEAYVNERGQLRYRDCLKGYPRRVSYSELLSLLHGEDIRALRAMA